MNSSPSIKQSDNYLSGYDAICIELVKAFGIDPIKNPICKFMLTIEAAERVKIETHQNVYPSNIQWDTINTIVKKYNLVEIIGEE